MATKPRKYCASWPCRNLSVPGSSYCTEHQARTRARFCRIQGCPDMALTGSSFCKQHQPEWTVKLADAFYVSVGWRRFREWYIANHPLCAECERQGKLVPGVIVDHVVELKDGGAPFDENNAQSLCRACHAYKTETERRKRNEKSSGTLGNNRAGAVIS